LKEDALEVRRREELAERLVAELAIEAGGLEDEGVEPGRMAAVLKLPSAAPMSARPMRRPLSASETQRYSMKSQPL
jgi:hypothetical protein